MPQSDQCPQGISTLSRVCRLDGFAVCACLVMLHLPCLQKRDIRRDNQTSMSFACLVRHHTIVQAFSVCHMMSCHIGVDRPSTAEELSYTSHPNWSKLDQLNTVNNDVHNCNRAACSPLHDRRTCKVHLPAFGLLSCPECVNARCRCPGSYVHKH